MNANSCGTTRVGSGARLKTTSRTCCEPLVRRVLCTARVGRCDWLRSLAQTLCYCLRISGVRLWPTLRIGRRLDTRARQLLSTPSLARRMIPSHLPSRKSFVKLFTSKKSTLSISQKMSRRRSWALASGFFAIAVAALGLSAYSGASSSQGFAPHTAGQLPAPATRAAVGHELPLLPLLGEPVA